jgi:hypothetical protein
LALARVKTSMGVPSGSAPNGARVTLAAGAAGAGAESPGVDELHAARARKTAEVRAMRTSVDLGMRCSP